MNRHLAGRSRPDVFLALAALLLVALALYPWLAPTRAPAVSSEPAGSRETAPVVAALPPLATFSEVFQRPLFSPSRRATAPAPTLENGLAARFRLLGLIKAGTTRRALIFEGKRRFEVAEGALLDGWTVAHIAQDRVVLSSPRGRMVLTLHPGEAPSAAPEKFTR